MNPHIPQLQRLFDETTVVRMEDNQNQQILLEKQLISPDWHPQFLYQRDPFDFSALENHWENKWVGYGDQWSNERQTFRYIWYEVRAFVQSYRLYRENFFNALNLSFEEDQEARARRSKLDLNAELSVRSMYEYGKQAIDLLTTVANNDTVIAAILDAPANNTFLSQFKETRNKFLIHYHNPHRFNDLIFDPGFYSLMGTGSLFEIRIHIANQTEHRFSAYINHYADYFNLEQILIEIIQTF